MRGGNKLNQLVCKSYCSLSIKQSNMWTAHTVCVIFNLWSILYLFITFDTHTHNNGGAMWWQRLLRQCTTSWKVAVSTLGGVTGNFHWHHTYGCPASNRNEYQEYFLGSKSSQCIGLTTLPPSSAVLKSGNLNSWNPWGLYSDCFTVQWYV